MLVLDCFKTVEKPCIAEQNATFRIIPGLAKSGVFLGLRLSLTTSPFDQRQLFQRQLTKTRERGVLYPAASVLIQRLQLRELDDLFVHRAAWYR
jgi:hypothetical protein